MTSPGNTELFVTTAKSLKQRCCCCLLLGFCVVQPTFHSSSCTCGSPGLLQLGRRARQPAWRRRPPGAWCIRATGGLLYRALNKVQLRYAVVAHGSTSESTRGYYDVERLALNSSLTTACTHTLGYTAVDMVQGRLLLAGPVVHNPRLCPLAGTMGRKGHWQEQLEQRRPPACLPQCTVWQ
jgi:hypothetical protein